MQEIIITGKTVEEATENACRELGLGRDEVSVEILEMPVKKFFKSIPAKVKVTPIDDEPVKVEVAPAPKAAKLFEAKKQEVAKPVVKKIAEQKNDDGKLLAQEPEEEIDLSTNVPAKAAVDYLASIITAMGANSDVKIVALKQGDATLLRVSGETINQKMEIRGETIQALSYLIDRAVNTGVDKKDSEYVRIRLDIADYRNRRESELMALALRTGKEVAETKRSKTLAPMNPYERLIVHTAISKIEGIASESIGSDIERRVVVKSLAADATAGADWRPSYKNKNSERGSSSRGGRSSGPGRGGRSDDRGGKNRERDNRSGGYRGDKGGGPPPSNTPQREFADKPRNLSTAPIVPDQREAIQDGEDLPLYGKIEL